METLVTPPPNDSLPAILQQCWDLLAEGQRLGKSPFHQAVLATATPRGPSSRYVVLRQVDREHGVLGFHTDCRSEKWAELELEPRVALCFFGQAVQIRVEGCVKLHTDDAIADLAWKHTGLMSRRTYLVEPAPGTVLAGPSSGLPERLSKQRPTEEESEVGRARFAVVSVHLQRLEWLSLALEGQRRARFHRTGTAPWTSEWLLP